MCKHCACCVCGGKDGPDKQLLCDECDQAYHLWCLTPPLETVPESDEWYCPQCKTDCTEVIKAGDKMRLSKKKANMASNKQSCNRDWGRVRDALCGFLCPYKERSVMACSLPVGYGLCWTE